MTIRNVLLSSLLISVLCLLSNTYGLLNRAHREQAPPWVKNQPYSRTHYIGIGAAKIEDELSVAQNRARKRALAAIAEQIEVSLVSHMVLHDQSTQKNKLATSHSSMHESITSFTKSAFTEWEEKATWHSPSGYYWSKVVLNKRAYQRYVNRILEKTIAQVEDIIEGGYNLCVWDRIKSLCQGDSLLSQFPDVTLRGRVFGTSVILENEIDRMIAQIFQDITFKPTHTMLRLGSSDKQPMSLGVIGYYRGKRDCSLPLHWTASNNQVVPQGQCSNNRFMYPVTLSSIPPTIKPIVVTATLDVQQLPKKYRARRWKAPQGSFTIIRHSAPCFVESDNHFTHLLAKELENRSTVTLVNTKEDAAYVIGSQFTKSDSVALCNSVYIADGTLSVRVYARGGVQLVNVQKNVRAADGISARRALWGTEKVAVDLAIKTVENIF